MRFSKADGIFSRVSRLGFTLMEVNLAIFIMAVGLLAMVAVYPLAYRESQQSKDDVKAAAAADCVLNTLTAALSSRNIQWNDWENGISSAMQKTRSGQSGGGWLAYCDQGANSYTPKNLVVINNQAKLVFDTLAAINKDHKPSWPLSGIDSDLACAIVAQWGKIPVWENDRTRMMDDRSRVAISVRLTRRAGELLAQPIFYTEIHFQGDQKDVKE
jgi:hypothetical protein